MKRILFVDDEPRILEGFERLLRPQRTTWEMTFASSGQEALGALAAGAFDVIVTDMRMPGMDGVQLLDQVRTAYPEVIRIVLSGYFDEQAAIRAVPVAHKFLMKPCTRDTLREAIESSCGWRGLLNHPGLRKVVGAMGELPTLSQTSSALLKALEDPSTHWDEIGRIVEQDVGVAARVLQLVNSAFFHLAHEVSSIAVAVSYLGIELLKQLVLSVEVFRSFPLHGPRAFSMEAFQNHSRLAACVARGLPLGRSLASAAAIASFLHDTGKLVLTARLPKEFDAAVAEASRRKLPLWMVEEQMLGTSHAEVGAYLLGLWGMPSPVIMAIAGHHHPAGEISPDDPDLATAVHIADVLASEYTWRGAGWSPNEWGGEAVEGLARLGVGGELAGWRTMTGEIIRNGNWT
ncbi:MAG: response regulator [Acidobacteria bacterium]|nr:response regulator [Acidobacteriota bacterium]